MEKMLQTFEARNIGDPGTRWQLFVYSSEAYISENILFLICCWDYVYRPTFDKAGGLQELFIRKESPIEINLSDKARGNAMRTLDNPFQVQQQNRGRRGAVSQQSTELSGYSGPGMTGGVQMGGAGNYNLVTQAITPPVLEVDMLVRNLPASTNPYEKVKSGKTSKQPDGTAVEQANRLKDYWGTDFAGLSVGK